MTKKMNTANITNELKEASLFFTRPTPPIEPVTPEQDSTPSPSNAAVTPANDDTRTPRTDRTPRTSRTGTEPQKRSMKRHSFEIYLDQYDSLVRIAAQERMAGGVGSMSQMVRKALDRLIAERNRKGE